VILDVGMLRVLRYFRMLFRSLRRLLSNLTAIVNIESIPFIIHGLHELDWYEGEMIVKTINEKSWFWPFGYTSITCFRPHQARIQLRPGKFQE
jgi:hypothetical protein